MPPKTDRALWPSKAGYYRADKQSNVQSSLVKIWLRKTHYYLLNEIKSDICCDRLANSAVRDNLIWFANLIRVHELACPVRKRGKLVLDSYPVRKREKPVYEP
jgi:hypothetical protein